MVETDGAELCAIPLREPLPAAWPLLSLAALMVGATPSFADEIKTNTMSAEPMKTDPMATNAMAPIRRLPIR